MFSSTVCMKTANIIMTLQLLSLLTMVQSLNQCTSGMPFDSVHGQRYTRCVYVVISNIGPQQCVSECIARKHSCQGVNYSRNRLNCEICASPKYSIPSEDYMKIDLGKVIDFLHKTSSFFQYKIHTRKCYCHKI
jgi:hypothetical protein